MKNINDIIKKHFSELGKRGGTARAAKYSPEKLSEWAKMGGRPKKIKDGLETRGLTKNKEARTIIESMKSKIARANT